MASSKDAAERFHALDALRAAMMFLGIYLHAVVAYSPNGGWPWKQAAQTRLLDGSISVIHVFRMPIFYAMAGFFTALGFVLVFDAVNGLQANGADADVRLAREGQFFPILGTLGVVAMQDACHARSVANMAIAGNWSVP